MSDYLASLIARNMEVAHRLEPRPATSFEPRKGLQPGGPEAHARTSADGPFEEHLFVDASDHGDDQRPPPPQGTAAAGAQPLTSPTSRDGVVQPSRETPQTTQSGSIARDSGSAPGASTPGASMPWPASRLAAQTTNTITPTPTVAGHPSNDSARGASVRRNPGRQPRRADSAQPQTRTPESRAPRSRGHEHGVNRRAVADRAVRIDDMTAIVSPPGSPVDGRRPVRDRASTSAPSRERDDSVPTTPLTAGPMEAHVSPRITAAASSRVDPIDEGRRAVPQTDAARSAIAVQVRLRQQTAGQVSGNGLPEPEAPATVHVTIGRLEVRATPSATAAPKRPAAPAATSLDDYLRRRADGSGR
jgi:hypothetical protein